MTHLSRNDIKLNLLQSIVCPQMMHIHATIASLQKQNKTVQQQFMECFDKVSFVSFSLPIFCNPVLKYTLYYPRISHSEAVVSDLTTAMAQMMTLGH